MKQHAKGMSLVELSVVLVVVGLLLGITTSGTHLLRAMNLNKIMTDINQYQDAIVKFEAQYHFLPGDMNNADSFWPGQTSNGNGNGIIEYAIGSGNAAANESMRAWQHLNLSELIRSDLTGEGINNPTVVLSLPPITTPGNNNYALNQNVPLSSLSGIGYNLIGGTISGSTTQRICNSEGNGGAFLNFNMLTAQGFNSLNEHLSVLQIRRIDRKIDDGLPQRGEVLVYSTDNANRCTTGGAVPFDADYDLTIETLPVCIGLFRLKRAADTLPRTQTATNAPYC